MHSEDARLTALQEWLVTQGFADYEIAPASADASFRRYFRVIHNGESHIVMDAPPDKEDCLPFVRIGAALRGFGMNVPQVLAQDLKQGFLLLSDLGNRQYLDELNDGTVDRLYWDAIDALIRMQAAGKPDMLPPYDEALLQREMSLFPEWLLADLLKIEMDERARLMLAQTFQTLTASALKQRRVWVHRDYHSRNLMLCEGDNPGVLDFQDAVFGPLTYDLASLLRDCYIEWPRSRVEAWLDYYRREAAEAGVLHHVERAKFIEQFDLMGMQRHLKAAGIFARLYLRDGKQGYLKDIPRTLAYILDVAARYPELRSFRGWMLQTLMPAVARSDYFR